MFWQLGGILGHHTLSHIAYVDFNPALLSSAPKSKSHPDLAAHSTVNPRVISSATFTPFSRTSLTSSNVFIALSSISGVRYLVYSNGVSTPTAVLKNTSSFGFAFCLGSSNPNETILLTANSICNPEPVEPTSSDAPNFWI